MRHPFRIGLALVAAGVVLAIVAVVILFANGGFQLPGYGGMTEQQRAEMDRAGALSIGPAVAAVVAFLVGVGFLVVALVRRKGGPGAPSTPPWRRHERGTSPSRPRPVERP